MSEKVFQTQNPNISNNNLLRIPQREGYEKIVEHYNKASSAKETGIILPVGCGKSGLITLVPFAMSSKKTLVIAPRLKITEQLYKDFDPTNPKMFYLKCKVLSESPYPEPVEIRGTTANKSDLDEADVVVTNIDQLRNGNSRWQDLPEDYFDLILFDEGHHNVADSWVDLKKRFPKARIVNFSATPLRADGQLMSGEIIYSYPVFHAIKEGSLWIPGSF